MNAVKVKYFYVVPTYLLKVKNLIKIQKPKKIVVNSPVIEKPRVEQRESLFVRLKENADLITLPQKWYRELSENNVTFFTLSNSSFSSIRIIERQLMINQGTVFNLF